ncbi:MAG: hypothetical protein ACYSRQ_06555 [Planctomycetota bacterium]|jgi:hypothetical protein
MNIQGKIKYVTAPIKFLIVVIILLLTIAISQFITSEIIISFLPKVSRYEIPRPELKEEKAKQLNIADAVKEFLPDGSIHLLYYPDSKKQIEDYQIYDVNGNLLWIGESKNRIPYKYISFHMNSLYGLHAEEIKSEQSITPFFYRVFIVPVVPSKGLITEYWRYELIKGYFTGFDPTGREIGYAASNGVKTTKSEIEPFTELMIISPNRYPDSYNPVLFLQTTNKLYLLDFLNRSVNILFDAREDEIKRIYTKNWFGVVEHYSDYLYNIENSEYRPAIHIITKKGKHHLLLGEPDEYLELNIPQNWIQGSVSIAAIKNTTYLHYSDSEGSETRPDDNNLLEQWLEEYRYRPYKSWNELYEVDSKGSLHLLNRLEWTCPAREKSANQVPEEWIKSIKQREQVSNIIRTFSSPILYELMWLGYYKEKVDGDTLSGFDELVLIIAFNVFDIYSEAGELTHIMNIPLNFLVSMLMVCVVLWYGWPRRTSWIKLIFWLAVAAVFNLTGLITYFVLNYSTAIMCPVCGKKRGLARVDCVRCGAALPAPEPSGHELIFNV